MQFLEGISADSVQPMRRYHALLYIPHSGLFVENGGEFCDGRQQHIRWDRSIRVYNSHARAVEARDRILEKRADLYSEGRIMILNVDLKFEE